MLKERKRAQAQQNREKTANQKAEEEKQRIMSLLEKYKEKDEESPDTETESGVNSYDMSGSEEEEIDYTNTQVNREDLPYTEFNYKNKEHASRILEAARSDIF